ncbi:uncharacterized protein LOC128388259 [Panonychus citri]|uniref:uncharacterized protein LOC128388259 n=1 Tax=Panonychus citri TaxID=50023 RepID=UPI0023078FB1|nr:uncharacterized protein LOC128388259 [Panonychus citri]
MEDQMTSLNENMKVTIVNRKKSYEISKQKLSSIPYFVKLFSNSNCAVIELDLDESSFDNIIEFILDGHLSISIESAFLMMEITDYLGMDEIKQKYYDFYKSNFNIKLLNEFLDFYEKRKSPEMFADEKLNSFIAKFFLPITRTRAFLKFPVALLERILKLNLVVSSEHQIYEAIKRWIFFNKKARKQYLPQLMKFINFSRLNDEEIKIVASTLKASGFTPDTPPSKKQPPRACLPEFCQFDCMINRQYNKSLVAIYELGKDKINIRRLSKSNLWTKYGQFTRDETMSTSLIEANHIVDIIYACGHKGIRVDLIGKKFKYLEMFGDDDSYYGQVYKYFAHDIKTDNTYIKIRDSQSGSINNICANVNMKRLEAIFLGEHLEAICDGTIKFVESARTNCRCSKQVDWSDWDSKSCGHNESCRNNESDMLVNKPYYCPSLDYRKSSSCESQGPVQTRSCLLSKPDKYSGSQKILCFLTKRDFRRQHVDGHRVGMDASIVLDFSFLKDFIESDSLDHIELISHENSLLICNKETKMIYSYIDDTDYWQLMSKIESPEKMIAIASICLPIDFDQ